MVVVGAGFGGLRAVRRLRGSEVDVTVVDRRNYHTFLPLLYEVAAAGLVPDDIAQPVRAIVRGAANVRFRIAEALAVDLDRRTVAIKGGELAYDYLIAAAGSRTNHFGVASAQQHALGLKDLADATRVRNRLLRSFEGATLVGDQAERARLMTAVIIGGGPTGVELSGALAELKRHVLPRDYPELPVEEARVILIEAMETLLGAMPPVLGEKAARQLEQLGVEVRLRAPVRDVTESGVSLASGEVIAAATVVWVAGVRGEALAEHMGLAVGSAGRIPVETTLQLAQHPEAYVIGDLALLDDPHGRPYPMVAPVAMQQGELAAANILHALRGEALETFRYRDRGTMATIGRRMAVAHVFGLNFTGFVAWLLWLTVHLIQLVGLRNRALVLVNWAWNYFRYDRANRLVTDEADEPPES